MIGDVADNVAIFMADYDTKIEDMFKEFEVLDNKWNGDSIYLWRSAEGDEKYWIWEDNPGGRLNSMQGPMKEGQRTTRVKKTKRSAKPIDDGITPKGGFLNYGVLSSDYVLIHGSIPGPTNRLIRLRDPIRAQFTEKLKDPPKLVFISRESKQGV